MRDLGLALRAAGSLARLDDEGALEAAEQAIVLTFRFMTADNMAAVMKNENEELVPNSVEVWKAALACPFVAQFADPTRVRDSCSKYIEIAKPFLEMKAAISAYDTSSHASNDLGGRAKAFEKLQSLFMNATTCFDEASRPKDTEDKELFGTFVENVKGSFVEHFSSCVLLGCNWFAESLAAKVTSAAHDLGQVAGGAAGGAVWSASMAADGDVLEHFGRTLNTIDTKQISKYTLVAETVVSSNTGPGTDRIFSGSNHFCRKIWHCFLHRV